ncbi:MAG: NAD(+)/NADH kinase [Arenicellales bacterium]
MQHKTIGLFGKYGSTTVESTLENVKNLLESFGASVLLGDTTASEMTGERILDKTQYESLDFAVVVGGDGTLLHAARTLAAFGTPIVGINLGRLGFLTDIPADEIEFGLRAIKDGEYRIEQRDMLETIVSSSKDNTENRYLSLNDAVISKGDTGRLIEMSIHVDDVFVSKTRSDGLIIATPTGSTAYALSAGGPIIEPTLPVVVLVPICPHTLSNRPIILGQDSTIRISEIQLTDNHATLAVDGIIVQVITGDERITLAKAEHALKLIRIDNHSHFEALRVKLGWTS